MKNINIKNNIYVCGDFNIDLLQRDTNKLTGDFVDMVFSLGLYPLIIKPTRITATSATIIDNIFTNNIKCKIESGILVSDITDHLPIFSSCASNNCSNTTVKKYL